MNSLAPAKGLHSPIGATLRPQENDMAKGMNKRKEVKKPKKEAAKATTSIAVASTKGGLNVNKPKE